MTEPFEVLPREAVRGDYLGASETAKRLGVRYGTAIAMIRRGEFAHVVRVDRAGHPYLVPRHEVERVARERLAGEL